VAAAQRRIDAEALAPYYEGKPERPIEAVKSRPVENRETMSGSG